MFFTTELLLPLVKGARGMFLLLCFPLFVYMSYGTSPCPLHKGDFDYSSLSEGSSGWYRASSGVVEGVSPFTRGITSPTGGC